MNVATRPARWCLGLLLPVLLLGQAAWGGARVVDVHAEVRDGVVFLDADLAISPSQEVIEAMRNSIALNLVLEADIAEPREWLWDRRLASGKRRLKLEYHALSQTWMVTDFAARETHTFTDLSGAVASLSRIRAWRLARWEQLDGRGRRLLGRMRIRLEVNKLPLPLRVPALINPAWDLDSDWFLWSLSGERDE
ncbi:MAG: DUF4390 domain-containing protein [Guyparkeria sp.]|uniref:DUF4390 domain-containing protein n=1 Tax=Guyparkeria sp. TaxID=2035736 RepID=UPI00397B4C32